MELIKLCFGTHKALRHGYLLIAVFALVLFDRVVVLSFMISDADP